jgi:hypothetical protein
VISAVIAGRLGDPHRFTSLAAIRAYTGLVPKISQSGLSKIESSITKAGDPLLREMLCTAADQARKIDPQIAAKYQRLMTGDRHHDSAICHLATLLVTRIATCMRNGQPEASPVSCTPRYVCMKPGMLQAAGQESQESPSAPTSKPAKPQPTTHQMA